MNYYYPSGGTFASAEKSTQPYKYNGKELDTKNGLNWYDYGARQYDTALGRWNAVDPMAEKYYSWSPYTYCLNNPMNRIDPTGMDSFYNWERESYKDERRDEVSWMILRLSFNRIGHSESHDVPPTSKDVDAVTGATPKVDLSLVVPTEKANVAPSIPLNGIIGFTISKTAASVLGLFAAIPIILQGDTNPDDVREVIKKKKFTTTTDEFAHEKTNKGGKLKGAKGDNHDKQYTHGGENRPKNPNQKKGAEERRNKGRKIIDYKICYKNYLLMHISIKK